MARSWYAFQGGETDDPGNYRKISTKPACLSGSTICAIYAPSGGTFPDSPFSANLLQYITDSASASVPRPALPGAKFYLYKID